MISAVAILDGQSDGREDHLAALGLISTSAYKLWCRRSGFAMDLEKSEAERAAELAFAREQAAASDIGRSHSLHRAEYIERIAAGELDGKPVTEIGSRVRTLFAEVDDIDGGRQALLRLLLHVEKYGNLLNNSSGFRGLGKTNRNQVISGLSQLARHHQAWIRRPEDWKPTTKKPKVQFRTLAAHLLAAYPVPHCLSAAWFEEDREEAATQQQWYRHVGRGQNIRTADGLPFAPTKRTAHTFMTSPDAYPPPLVTLRMAQIRAMARDVKIPRLWAISTHERIRGRMNADFWTSIIHFLLNNPMLERSYIGPFIDYIHYTKFENRRIPQPDGSVRIAPPLHPNFAIKGRSIDKLVREVDDWHEQLSGEEYDYVEEWQPSGIGEFVLTEDNEALNARIRWTIQELHTSALLQLEGRMMHHCVGSYARRCMSGEASVWSLRSRKDEEKSEHYHVLTIAVDNGKRQVTQARGKFNLEPHGSKTRRKHRKTDSNYRAALRESARILALWRKEEALGYAAE